jgi:predicted transcriptional regulator of viral defense system
MINTLSYNYVEDFTDNLRRKGRYTFSLDEIRGDINVSEEALKKSLNRMTHKGKITPVRKGFYLVIPPEHSIQRVLPPTMFVDQMMKYLKKPYYVGLLNAAAIHGAGHQAAQEFFVVTVKPPLRPISKKGLKVNFITKAKISDQFLMDKKTETGYLKVSCPELTAVDLLIYEGRIGGINRCITILNELHEVMKPSMLKQVIRKDVPISVLQRLGYLLDLVLPGSKLSSVIIDLLQEKKYGKVPLKTGRKKSGFPVNEKWRVIENFIPESDL